MLIRKGGLLEGELIKAFTVADLHGASLHYVTSGTSHCADDFTTWRTCDDDFE